MLCPICKDEFEEIYSIRGITACIHCQLDRIWDYIEENRRNIDRLNADKISF